VEGQSAFSLGTVPAGTQLGFFLIQKGFTLNPELFESGGRFEFRNPETGQAAKISDTVSPVLVHIADDGTEQIVQGLVFHTADADPTTQENLLNPTGQTQVVSGLFGNDGNLTLSFEDQTSATKGVDYDYNDNTFQIQFGSSYSEQLSGTDVGSESQISDDGTTARGATVVLVSGQQTGDRIDITDAADANGDNVIDGTSITYAFDGTTGIRFSGIDSYDHYRVALDAIRYVNESGRVSAGDRQFSFTVTDEQGLTSNPAMLTVRLENTIIRGGEGGEALLGSGQDDLISGRAGDDRIDGGQGNDLIDGGDGKDVLTGGSGDDLLNGGASPDSLFGGSGADMFRIGSVTERLDTIHDFSVAEGDQLLLSDLLQGTGFNPAQAEKWLKFETADLDGTGGRNDVQLSVDLDGDGKAYAPMPVVQFYNPQGLAEQVNDGSLEIDRIVISRRTDASGAA
jgi:Ca2+-binding RTX toxin-like protein